MSYEQEYRIHYTVNVSGKREIERCMSRSQIYFGSEESLVDETKWRNSYVRQIPYEWTSEHCRYSTTRLFWNAHINIYLTPEIPKITLFISWLRKCQRQMESGDERMLFVFDDKKCKQLRKEP